LSKQPPTEEPDSLKPYTAHGLQPVYGPKDKEAIAECPFCSGKFSINLFSGLARCFGCNKGSEKSKAIRGFNPTSFLRAYHALCFEKTTTEDYRKLADDRMLLSIEGLIDWGLCKSINTGHWLLPAYNGKEQLSTLFRRIWNQAKSRFILYPTPTMGSGMFLHTPFNPSKSTIDVCEGPWDGIALYECLRSATSKDGKLVSTSSNEYNVASDHNVLALPGNLAFNEAWCELFAGKIVNLFGDNDHPRVHPQTGEVSTPAGYLGSKRTAEILGASKTPPAQINFVDWGVEGYDPNLPSGMDVRDFINL